MLERGVECTRLRCFALSHVTSSRLRPFRVSYTFFIGSMLGRSGADTLIDASGSIRFRLGMPNATARIIDDLCYTQTLVSTALSSFSSAAPTATPTISRWLHLPIHAAVPTHLIIIYLRMIRQAAPHRWQDDCGADPMQCAFAPISSAASLYSVMYMSPLGRSAWRQRALCSR